MLIFQRAYIQLFLWSWNSCTSRASWEIVRQTQSNSYTWTISFTIKKTEYNSNLFIRIFRFNIRLFLFLLIFFYYFILSILFSGFIFFFTACIIVFIWLFVQIFLQTCVLFITFIWTFLEEFTDGLLGGGGISLFLSGVGFFFLGGGDFYRSNLFPGVLIQDASICD
jgi:hypothetical protein